MFCVYKHTAPNGKVYIGITADNPSHRWNNGNGYKANEHFYSAIQKYGWNNFKHEILVDGLTKAEACQKEIEMIKQYKSNDRAFGYNISIGGEATALGSHHTEETKMKMSESRHGVNAYWFGKHRSSETIEKIIKAKQGKPMHEITRKALLYAVQHQTAETRQKISDSLIGNTRAAKHKVLCVETGIVYESISDASRKTKIDRSSISRACNNIKKDNIAGNHHWKFI